MILKPSQKVENLKGDLGGMVEKTLLSMGTPSTGVLAKFLFTLPAASELTQGEYLYYVLPGGSKVAAWFNIDADDTPPSGALYTGADQKLEVAVLSTATAEEVADALVAAVTGAGVAGMTLSQDVAEVLLVNDLLGVLTAPQSLLEDDSAAGVVSVVGSVVGTLAGLQSKAMTLTNLDDDKFYLWANINGQGVDPSLPGTGSAVVIAAEALPAAVYAAYAAAINALADFTSNVQGSGVTLSYVGEADVVDADVGDTGFTASVDNGSPEHFSNAGSPGGPNDLAEF